MLVVIFLVGLFFSTRAKENGDDILILLLKVDANVWSEFSVLVGKCLVDFFCWKKSFSEEI